MNIAIASLGLGYVTSAATLEGQVALKGTPKKEITINMSTDPKCGALHTAPVTTRHYVTGANGGLANVLVFVSEGLPEKEWPAPSNTPILDQQGCEYSPYVMGVRVDQKFKIKNSDPTLHNVHATPKPGSGNKEFNFAQPLKGMETVQSFAAPEVPVRFKCDVHPWMFAYVGVFKHPFFAVTDKDGKFKIEGLPDGKYTVEAFHVKTHRGDGQGIKKAVEVSGDTKADFTIQL